MIHESTTITLTCDRKGCGNMSRVNSADETAANLILYKLGWRSAHRRGKDIQLCPAHAARESRRLSKRARLSVADIRAIEAAGEPVTDTSTRAHFQS